MVAQPDDGRVDPLKDHLLGKYRIVQLIGSGAMSRVYRALDTTQGDAEVAIKILTDNIAADPLHRRRFRREVETVRKLDHPNILPILDYGEQGDLIYTVMPFIKGRSLLDHLRRQSVLTPAHTAQVAQQLGSALDHAHSHEIVHRDIKPHNVMMLSSNRIALTDFGLAKLSDEVTRLTMSGTILGSPAYMSPEQARGGAIDHRADIYAMGVVTYQCLVGRLPYSSGNTMEVIGQHLNAMPLDPKEVNSVFPSAIASVLLKAMEKEPDARYKSAGDFAKALSDVIKTLPTPDVPLVSLDQIAAADTLSNQPVTVIVPPDPRGRRRQALAWGSMLLLLACVGMFVMTQVIQPMQTRLLNAEQTAQAASSLQPIVITQIVTNAAGQVQVINVTQMVAPEDFPTETATATEEADATSTPRRRTPTPTPTASSTPRPTATDSSSTPGSGVTTTGGTGGSSGGQSTATSTRVPTQAATQPGATRTPAGPTNTPPGNSGGAGAGGNDGGPTNTPPGNSGGAGAGGSDGGPTNTPPGNSGGAGGDNAGGGNAGGGNAGGGNAGGGNAGGAGGGANGKP